jgi:hypothetical protein
MPLPILFWLIGAVAFTLGWMTHSRIARARMSTFLEAPPSNKRTMELIDLTTGDITSPRR